MIQPNTFNMKFIVETLPLNMTLRMSVIVRPEITVRYPSLAMKFAFYNTFVVITRTIGHPQATLTPVELRTRNIIELVLNRQAYQEKYNRLLVFCDQLERYVVREMVRDRSYAATRDFFSMATVLNVHIISIYPRVNGNADSYQITFINAIFTSLTSQPNGDTTTDVREVRILFSNDKQPVKTREWLPNHFVPYSVCPDRYIFCLRVYIHTVFPPQTKAQHLFISCLISCCTMCEPREESRTAVRSSFDDQFIFANLRGGSAPFTMYAGIRRLFCSSSYSRVFCIPSRWTR